MGCLSGILQVGARRSVVRCALMVLTLAACWPQSVLASEQGEQRDPPRHRIVYSSLLALRISPLGLEERLMVGYHRRLYTSSSILWRDCFVGLDLTPVINPAQVALGAQITLRPIALLVLSARYSFLAWFGNFNYLQSFTSPHEDYSDTSLELNAEQQRNYSTSGGQLQLQAQVLGKLGHLVLRNDLKLFHHDVGLRHGDSLFYDFTLDAMVPDAGWVLSNDTDLVYLTSWGLVAGLRHTLVHALYQDRHYQPGESTDNPNTPFSRLGPLLAYVLYDKPQRVFNKPTLLLIVNWYLTHRFRTGADVSQGVPYVVLGFKFGGDLWRTD